MQNGIKVVRLPENTVGRDFCVGDIHGMFTLLDKLLEAVRFDVEKDRLLSVGDLVDRGPASERSLDYLKEPWFHAIRGNHEQMLIDCVENPKDKSARYVWERNGGSWWSSTAKSLQSELYEAFCELPYVIEVPTPRGLAGLVHADVPDGMSWKAFIQAVESGDSNTLEHVLWSRKRARQPEPHESIFGVTDIYCGHTVVPVPQSFGNVHFIDTGAYMTNIGRLTMVEIHKGLEYRHSYSSHQA